MIMPTDGAAWAGWDERHRGVTRGMEDIEKSAIPTFVDVARVLHLAAARVVLVPTVASIGRLLQPLAHLIMRAVSLLALTLSSVVSAQPVRSLIKPDMEFAEPFSHPTGLKELPDGRVVVIDTREKSVQVVDFTKGRLHKLGRVGGGPGEFGLPSSLHALPGDTSAIFDPLNSRFLLITPKGEVGDIMRTSASAAAGKRGGPVTVTISQPRYVDARGRFYRLGDDIQMIDGAPAIPDSLPILRLDRLTYTTDTLGYVRQPKTALTSSEGQGDMQVSMGVANPFAAGEEWFVTPDGRVGILRTQPYRMDWIAPSKVSGPAIPTPRLKLSEAHKQQWRASRSATTLVVMNSGTGGQGPREAVGVRMPEPTDWPEYLPPFLRSGQSIFVAPDGRVWVARTREAKDNTPSYDVFDASGKVALRVALAPRTRVIGFGRGVVYTLRSDEDDLQYLQRHRLPLYP